MIEGSFYRRVRVGKGLWRLEPVNVEAHLNPLTLALGLGVGAIGFGIGMWMLGLGVSVLTPENRAILEGHLAGNEREAERVRGAIAEIEARMRDPNAYAQFDPETQAFLRQRDRDALARFRAELKAYEDEIKRLERKLSLPFEITTRPRFAIDIGL